MCKFIMMIGIPGSGKSTYAKEIANKENAIIISSDELRKELFGNVWEIKRNAILFGQMHNRTHMYLNKGKNVIYDATNIRSSGRKSLLKKFKSFYKECYYIRISLEKALTYNSIRDRNVPEEIIKKMYENIEEPDMSEGWDKINIIDNI